MKEIRINSFSEFHEAIHNIPPDAGVGVYRGVLKSSYELIPSVGRLLPLFQKNGFNFVTDYKPAIEALTAENIRETLQKIVAQGNVMEVVMKPKQ